MKTNPKLSLESKYTDGKQQPHEYLILLSTFAVLIYAAYLSIKFQPQLEKLKQLYLSSTIGTVFLYFTSALLILNLLFLVFNIILYFWYKQIKSVGDTDLPTCTIIVPAYNEGALVYKTLLSIAISNYPKEKYQIIAVDDGSTDDTWSWIQKANNELNQSILLHKQPKNMGKRQALYYGFKKAIGEVIVTIDSDSIIEKNTLRNLVSPFVVNKNCGAVAGNVKVLNTKNGIIPKMLNVSFAFSFEFIRSAQSSLGSVFCTPGALAAYKTDVILKIKETWINQTFMGTPSDIGEDRAITNMILKEGYEVLFQKNAIVYTNIPERYKNLYKMLIRWERSNVRETIMMSKFAFKNFRKGSKIGTRIILIEAWLKLLLAFPLAITALALLIAFPVLTATTTLVGILIFSSIQMLFYAKNHSIYHALWAYPYSIFYAIALFWITPYSIATVKKGGWLTR
jgi:hyaluronan synthase